MPGDVVSSDIEVPIPNPDDMVLRLESIFEGLAEDCDHLEDLRKLGQAWYGSLREFDVRCKGSHG